MRMIGVVVREEHSIDPVDTGGNQLQPQLRRGVDEYAGAALGLHQRTHPGALVARISRPADRAPAPKLRNAKARSGSEEGQFQRARSDRLHLHHVRRAGHVEGHASGYDDAVPDAG